MECFEVDELSKELLYVKKDLLYEATTCPGNGHDVKKLLIESMLKIEEIEELFTKVRVMICRQ